MPKFSVARRASDASPNAPSILCRTSPGPLKEELRKYPDSEWEIYSYKVSSDVVTLCQIVENFDSIQPSEPPYKVRVRKGQVRKAK
jgi:hypothetical protein